MSFEQIGAHKNVWEYDGAYKCLDCQSKWGELNGSPVMPEECNPKVEQTARTAVRQETIEECAKACEDQIVPSYQAGGDVIEAANYAFRAAAGAIRALSHLSGSQQPRSGDLAGEDR